MYALRRMAGGEGGGKSLLDFHCVFHVKRNRGRGGPLYHVKLRTYKMEGPYTLKFVFQVMAL